MNKNHADTVSYRWLLQHKALQQLNIQAHSNAQRNADPFVMEAVLTFNKLPVLLHELLVSEAWSWRICPLIKSRVAGRNAMRAYFAVRLPFRFQTLRRC
jgi:hypothetical protein